MFEKILPDLRAKAELEAILKCRATSTEERYKVLDARDKLLRLLIKDEVNYGIGVSMQGTCPDMCPEKERLFRDAKHQVSVFELTAKDGFSLDHNLAVKQYARSSANQESPLAHEVRSESVLRLTMDYLINEVMDKVEKLHGVHIGEWYHFLWDRTRSIRKDIIQQELCSVQAVVLIEECARFHIHCAARLIAEDPAFFDQKINTENLTKCLQTLKYMYNDLRLKNIQCLNESEFRGYIVLLNLNDSNFLADIKTLSTPVRSSQEIKFALEVAKCVANNNYVRFFELVRQTSYLNACILLRYFTQLRVSAIRTIMKSYHWPRYTAGISVVYLCELLAFENEKCCTRFFEEYGLRIVSNKVMLDRRLFRNNQEIKTVERALNVVEAKRQSSIADVVCGNCAFKREMNGHVARSSFDSNGYLKDEAFDVHDNLKYLKKALATTGNKEISELPRSPLSISENEETPNFMSISTSGDAIMCNNNTHFLNNVKSSPTIQVRQGKSYSDKRTYCGSYEKLNLTDWPETSFGSGGSMVFQERAEWRLQPSVDNLHDESPKQIHSMKNTLSKRNLLSVCLNSTYQLSDLENTLKDSMNFVSNKCNSSNSQNDEILNHNEVIVEDVIFNYVTSKLAELSRYELAKLDEIRNISVLELENLINSSTSIQVTSIACGQLSMFKKNKISKHAEAPSSWISDNLLNKKLKFDVDKSLRLMKPLKITKSNDKSKISYSKSSISLQSESLRLPKILVSFPDRYEADQESDYLLNCYAKITEGGAKCILTKNFPDKAANLCVCLHKIVGHQILAKNYIENLQGSEYVNSIIFFMTVVNISSAEKRLHNLLEFFQISRAVPLHLIVCDFNVTSRAKRHKFQVDNFILKSCFFNYTVHFCDVNENLPDAIIESLKYISIEECSNTEFGMQNIRTFLCNVLGSFFWKRISEAWFVFFSFRQYCTDPNRIIGLYNEALKRVRRLLLFSPSDRLEESENQNVLSDCLYSNEAVPKNHNRFLWNAKRNNHMVIRFLERLNLNSADFDFSSFENLKHSIEAYCHFMNLPQNLAGKKVNNILQHFPDNLKVKQKIREEVSWIRIVETISLEILDSNWVICNKDMPPDVFYHRAFYDDYVSNVWWVNEEFLSNFKNASLAVGVLDHPIKQKYCEEENTSKKNRLFKLMSPGLKRKGEFTEVRQPKQEKKMFEHCRDIILKEELTLRNWESLKVTQRLNGGSKMI